MTLAQPLYPDGTKEYYYHCWNCGNRPQSYLGSTYMCDCGCGWSIRYGVIPEQEQGMLEFREANIARQLKYPLVDFTKPGAPSSPA